MREINSIQDFQALSGDQQMEVQKAIKAKDRLDQFLLTLNRKSGSSGPPHWEECSRCKPFGYPGYVYRAPRDGRDVHPSQINKCLKFLYYSCAGYADQMEEYVSSRIRMIFDLGHAWHDTIQRYGERGAWGKPEHYYKEVPIDPEAMSADGSIALPVAQHYQIRGSIDALLTRYEMNVPGLGEVAIRLIHEYKTIKSSEYEKLSRPKPEHKYQATIYAAVFNVPLVIYIYTNKDNCQMADFPVPFDTSIWNEVTQKIDRMRYYVDHQMLPPWDETSAVKNPSECMDCGFRKLCQPPVQQLGRRTA